MTIDKKLEEFATVQLSEEEKPRYNTLEEMKDAGAIDIPFAVLAMTRKEAGELFDGKEDVFGAGQRGGNNAQQAERFRAFQQVLQQLVPADKCDEWCGQYSDDPHTREEWAPYGNQVSIMKLTVQAAIDFYQDKKPQENCHHDEAIPRFFWPDFQHAVPALFEQDELDEHLQAWRKLHKGFNSVLVIDGVSLFHPVIRGILKASPLGWRNNYVGVLIFFPQHANKSLEKLLEQEIRAEMRVAFARSRKPDFHQLYKFGIREMDDVRKWLYTDFSALLPERNTSVNAQSFGDRHGIEHSVSQRERQ